MTKRTITAYEAPALIDAHGAMTRLALYERLAGPPGEPPEAGLASRIAGGVIEHAAEEHGWAPPLRQDFRLPIEGTDLVAHARGYVSRDEEGTFLAVFQHVPTYLHANAWNKAGVPPETAVVQAQWALMAAKAERLGYVVLADKRIVVYWVYRDEEIATRLRDGAIDMDRRIRESDAPPVDATTIALPQPVRDGPAEGEVDLDVLAARWRATQIERAAARNQVQFREQAYDAASAALKAALAPGGHHDYDGYRIHRNAKTDAITEEKIDGLYF